MSKTELVNSLVSSLSGSGFKPSKPRGAATKTKAKPPKYVSKLKFKKLKPEEKIAKALMKAKDERDLAKLAKEEIKKADENSKKNVEILKKKLKDDENKRTALDMWRRFTRNIRRTRRGSDTTTTSDETDENDDTYQSGDVTSGNSDTDREPPPLEPVPSSEENLEDLLMTPTRIIPKRGKKSKSTFRREMDFNAPPRRLPRSMPPLEPLTPRRSISLDFPTSPVDMTGPSPRPRQITRRRRAPPRTGDSTVQFHLSPTKPPQSAKRGSGLVISIPPKTKQYRG
jgi:hypothetical protein